MEDQIEQEQPVEAKTSGLAVTALILSIVSYIPCFTFLASIPAIICGHMAHSNIGKSAGKLKGGGLAIVALVLGYLNIVVLIGGVVYFFNTPLGEVSYCVGKLGGVKAEIDQYKMANGGSYPKKLSELPGSISPECPAVDGEKAKYIYLWDPNQAFSDRDAILKCKHHNLTLYGDGNVDGLDQFIERHMKQ